MANEPLVFDGCKANEEIQNSEYRILTDTVRKHYLNYLERQLIENYKNWQQFQSSNGSNVPSYDFHNLNNIENCYHEKIRHIARILEDEAIKVCMIAQLYQRSMVKIIANVRRYTQEQRLVKQLAKLLSQTFNSQDSIGNKFDNNNNINKSTQTDSEEYTNKQYKTKKKYNNNSAEITECTLQKQIISPVLPSSLYITSNTKLHQSNRLDLITDGESISFLNNQNNQLTTPQVFSADANIAFGTQCIESINNTDNLSHDSNDSIGLEMARLFRDESTEFDGIFDVDTASSSSDYDLLQEIQNNRNEHTKNSRKTKTSPSNLISTLPIKSQTKNSISTSDFNEKSPSSKDSNYLKSKHKLINKPFDLKRSLWPCELYRQRRKLSTSLSRLVDEDYRWFDIIKWRFTHLFGEDSDDEFDVCSPSIELDDILMNSCKCRISPWVVKHLMRPYKDGLIDNRYLFKKLAKHLSEAITIENQYPDENFIKGTIELYFCQNAPVKIVDNIIPKENINFPY